MSSAALGVQDGQAGVRAAARARLRRRFGADFAEVGMYPIPVLTRDIPGYQIPPHPDTRWKGITVQLYLPRDAMTSHIGTIFHVRLPDGSLAQRADEIRAQYRLCVCGRGRHLAFRRYGRTGGQDADLILLTYFVDAGVLRACAIAASGSAISSATSFAIASGRAALTLVQGAIETLLTAARRIWSHGHPQAAPDVLNAWRSTPSRRW